MKRVIRAVCLLFSAMLSLTACSHVYSSSPEQSATSPTEQESLSKEQEEIIAQTEDIWVVLRDGECILESTLRPTIFNGDFTNDFILFESLDVYIDKMRTLQFTEEELEQLKKKLYEENYTYKNFMANYIDENKATHSFKIVDPLFLSSHSLYLPEGCEITEVSWRFGATLYMTVSSAQDFRITRCAIRCLYEGEDLESEESKQKYLNSTAGLDESRVLEIEERADGSLIGVIYTKRKVAPNKYVYTKVKDRYVFENGKKTLYVNRSYENDKIIGVGIDGVQNGFHIEIGIHDVQWTEQEADAFVEQFGFTVNS